MRRAIPTHLVILAVVATAACGHRVEVPVAAAPAVDLDADRVAVVAADRSCHAVANALVTELNRGSIVRVEPDAAIRLEVQSCQHDVFPVVSVEQAVDAERGEIVQRRRVAVEGRAHAVVAVTGPEGELRAVLVGADRAGHAGEWHRADEANLRRATSRALTVGVARDVAEQVRPTPRLVQRRIYPNAATGSARDLTNRAVEAELAGELAEAYRLAALAHAADPTERTRAYRDELARLATTP